MQAFFWSVRARRRGVFGGPVTHAAAQAAVAAALLLLGLGISRVAGGPVPLLGAPVTAPAGGGTGAAAGAAAAPTGSAQVQAEILADGSGRAVLVVAGGRAALIDGGPPAVGLAVVSRLRELGIPSLSTAFLTDPRSSEALGLMAVMDAMPVGDILDLAPGSSCPAHAAVLEDARARGVPVRSATRGSEVSLGPARLQVLWPAADLAAQGSLPAGAGLVRLSDGSVRMLFAQGVDPAQLQAMQRLGPQLTSQVLELPLQAGAPWTSELLRLVAPRVALLEPPAVGGDTATLQQLAAARVVALEATSAADLGLQTDGHGLVLSFDPGLPGAGSGAAPVPAPTNTDPCA